MSYASTLKHCAIHVHIMHIYIIILTNFSDPLYFNGYNMTIKIFVCVMCCTDSSCSVVVFKNLNKHLTDR